MIFATAVGAEFSADRAHRLLLWRIWDQATPPLGFVMLNPSSADETRDDPTTILNMVRARAAGYGGVVQANLYSYRTPSPRKLKQAGYPGFACADEGNARAWKQLVNACADVVLVWGAHARCHKGVQVDGDRAVWMLTTFFPQEFGIRAPRLLCLGRLKGGAPRHPLHTAYAVPLQDFI